MAEADVGSGGVAARARPATLTLSTRNALVGAAFIVPSLIVFAVVIAYPLGSALYLSLFSVFTPTLESRWVGLANYAQALSSPEFWLAFRVNVIWTVATVILQVVLGVAVALLLNSRIVLRAFARSLILFPYFVSTVVAVLVWRWLFNDVYGILNNVAMDAGIMDMPVDWLGKMPNALISIIVVGAWKYFPFVVIAVLARLQTIPPYLYEAARLDGANAWSRFWDITLPQLRSVLIVVIMLRTIWDFKEFDIIFLLTGGGPLNQTKTIPLLVYQQAFGINQMGMAATYAVLMMFAMLAFIAVYLYRVRLRSDD